jgi:hypothetical protein
VTPLLAPSLVAQLGRHQLVPRQRVRGRFQGAHRSARLGSSIEFADVREYVAGDDPRRIDLAASRRHGRLQVTLTEAEDDAAAQVVVDRSASMWGGKAQTADRLAAALALLGARDGVRLWLSSSAGGRDHLAGGWARGSAALGTAVTLLGTNGARANSPGASAAGANAAGANAAGASGTRWDAVGATGTSRNRAGTTGAGASPAAGADGRAADRPGTGGAGPRVWGPAVTNGDGEPAGRPDLAAAVRRAARIPAHGPLVLLSDLLFDGWEDAIRALGSARRDALVLQVLAREELEPQLADDVRYVDVETGAEVEVGGDERTRDAYAYALATHLAAVEAACTSIGAAHLLVPDDADLAHVLLVELPALGLVR